MPSDSSTAGDERTGATDDDPYLRILVALSGVALLVVTAGADSAVVAAAGAAVLPLLLAVLWRPHLRNRPAFTALTAVALAGYVVAHARTGDLEIGVVIGFVLTVFALLLPADPLSAVRRAAGVGR